MLFWFTKIIETVGKHSQGPTIPLEIKFMKMSGVRRAVQTWLKLPDPGGRADLRSWSLTKGQRKHSE